MKNIRKDEKSIYIDLWGKTLEYDRIQYALYQLNSAFELRISEDTDTILNYRLNGVPYKVSTVNGQQTNDICPYSWESLEYVSKTIGEAGRCANEILSEYGIDLNPNWKEINKQWFAEVDRLEKLFGDALGKATQAALNNQAYKYQQAYNEELSKDFGLSFGVLSSSLTAHLLYAAQSAAKERKDHARAEKAAAEVMQNSHADITSQIFASVYPLYVDSLEPAMQKLLSQYYAYIISIFSKELGYSYEDVAATFDFKKSNGFVLGISENAKDDILKALQADPNNGNVIGYAIKNGILDNELCAYGKGAQLNFGNILKKWAISVLSEIYNAGKLFNKPLVTNENESIITGLISYYTFVSGIVIASEDWQDIILEVYGEEIDKVEKVFEVFAKAKESNSEIIKYAHENKKIMISDTEIARFIVVACELKHVSSQWYATCMDLDANQSISIGEVRERINNINSKIDAEIAILKKKAEQRKAEEQRRAAEEQQRKAEEQRQRELEKAKVKKTLAIVVPIIVVFIAFLIILNSVIIPNSKYNKAISLIDAAKYEDAIVAFEAMDGYKDSNEQIEKCETAIKDRKYQQASSSYSNKDYEEAYTLFLELSGYKDSSNMAKESALHAGGVAMVNKNYEKAIDWYAKAGYHEEVKAAKYQYVLEHKNNTDQTTFDYLVDLRTANYKDSSDLFSELYRWKIEIIAVNSDPESTKNMGSISKYKPVYIHFKLTGGPPNGSIIPYIKYTNPEGRTGTGSLEHNYYNGSTGWYGWEKGIYSTPAYGATGTLKLEFYTSWYNGDLIGTANVRITS